ncbi:MAG: FAD-binding oxidoreductase [Rhodobacter sp.]|jgi:FAD/FMN-containing dehydrogenase|nr:FAD-binding oxidoreductase [Rhodobacter sp.]
MQSFLDGLRRILGPAGLITDPADMAPYLTDWRRMFSGTALAVLRPANTDQVSEAIRLCAQDGVAIVPQGGNTGLAGGATPMGPAPQVVLSLSRMTAIGTPDPIGLVIEAQAGAILQRVKEVAADCGRQLPISLAAEGSATIGGIIATNAGGVNVLRYGMARDFVLGLEVVLPDGTVVNGLKPLRKDNAGFDWKHLFIGSEGAFGIVTAALLRLVPATRHRSVALLAVQDLQAAIRLLGLFQDRIGETLSAFELISADALRLVETQCGLVAPVTGGNWFLLVEAVSSLDGLSAGVEATLETAFSTGWVQDGTLAATEQQAQALWALREHVTEAEARCGKSLKHDVSLPVWGMGDFLDSIQEGLAGMAPAARMNVFGHLGDGNLHVNVILGDTPAACATDITRLVHDQIATAGGSISAEHGLGQYRLEEWRRLTPEAVLDLCIGIKRAMDPKALMNPGKAILGPFSPR